jgi:septum site-determining protein MinC
MKLFYFEESMPNSVQIKGIKEGLLISLGEGFWDEIQESFISQVRSQADFLKGAKLILDVGDHELNASTMGKMRDLLSDEGVSLWAILSQSERTNISSRNLGFATKIHQPKAEKIGKSIEGNIFGEESLFVERTLRSGNSIDFSGHVIVLGDVNPGAEIIADGNIVVMGHLRGVAHAGADGNTQAYICALHLSPTQLRIADKISISPPDNGQPNPEKAIILDDIIVAEKWNLAGFE